MDALFSFFGGINYEVLFQLGFLGLIVIAGPVVVFLLALNGGDI